MPKDILGFIIKKQFMHLIGSYEEGLETILYCLSLSIPAHKYQESVLCIMQFNKFDDYASDPENQIKRHLKGGV